MIDALLLCIWNWKPREWVYIHDYLCKVLKLYDICYYTSHSWQGLRDLKTHCWGLGQEVRKPKHRGQGLWEEENPVRNSSFSQSPCPEPQYLLSYFPASLSMVCSRLGLLVLVSPGLGCKCGTISRLDNSCTRSGDLGVHFPRATHPSRLPRVPCCVLGSELLLVISGGAGVVNITGPLRGFAVSKSSQCRDWLASMTSTFLSSF